MAKRSRSKTSRKERQQLRHRYEQAARRGLPTSLATREALKPPISRQATSLVSSGSDEVSSKSEQTDPAVVSQRRWLSSWPTSVKILVAASLVVIGIGLWRALAEPTSQQPAPIASGGNVSADAPPLVEPPAPKTPVAEQGDAERKPSTSSAGNQPSIPQASSVRAHAPARASDNPY